MTGGRNAAGAISSWGRRCLLRMPLRRLVCPAHGVVTEAVPFAGWRSGYSDAFEEARSG